MSGFVYIWRDKGRNRYYIGSHWGKENDGYVCSSDSMRESYKRRPQDFKRRIISRVATNRRDLLMEEQRWLYMIPDKMLGRRYYNFIKTTHHWYTDPSSHKSISEKCRDRELKRIAEGNHPFLSHKHQMKANHAAHSSGNHPFQQEEFKKRTSERMKAKNPMMIPEIRKKASESLRGKPSWNKGKPWSEEAKKKMSLAKQGYVPWNKGKKNINIIKEN